MKVTKIGNSLMEVKNILKKDNNLGCSSCNDLLFLQEFPATL